MDADDVLADRARDLLDKMFDCGYGDEHLDETDVLQGEFGSPAFQQAALGVIRALAAVQGKAVAALQVVGADNNQSPALVAPSTITSIEHELAKGDGAACRGLILALANTLLGEAAGVPATSGSDALISAIDSIAAELQACHMVMALDAKNSSSANDASSEEARSYLETGPVMSQAVKDLASTVLDTPTGAKPVPVTAGVKSAVAALEPLKQALPAAVAKLPKGYLEPLVKPSQLSQEQLRVLGEVHAALQDEYRVRRQMLVRRAQVTLQSFTWSARTKGEHAATVAQLIANGIAGMDPNPAVALEDLFRVRPADLDAAAQKTSSGASGRFHASVKQVQIGKVPDRGGRTSATGPPPDMPAFKPRAPDGGGRERSHYQCGIILHMGMLK
eukprot:jgi/Mesvir1/4507/Mv03786-RA.1